MKQRLTVLGSTGSIGTNTLDVVRRHSDQYEIFALSAATQVELMLAQCAEFAALRGDGQSVTCLAVAGKVKGE